VLRNVQTNSLNINSFKHRNNCRFEAVRQNGRPRNKSSSATWYRHL